MSIEWNCGVFSIFTSHITKPDKNFSLLGEKFYFSCLQIETYNYICIRLQQVSDLLKSGPARREISRKARATQIQAGVVELVDTLDLGSSASRCEGSSPFARTKSRREIFGFFIFRYFDIPVERKDEKFIPSAVEGSPFARTEKKVNKVI